MKLRFILVYILFIFIISACNDIEKTEDTEPLYPIITYTISTDPTLIKKVHRPNSNSIANKKVVSIQLNSTVKKGYSNNVRNLELQIKDPPNLISASNGGFQSPAFRESNKVTAIHTFLLEGSLFEAKKFLVEGTFILVWEDDGGKQQLELNPEDFIIE